MLLKSLLSFTISMVMMPQVHGGADDIILSKKISKDYRRTLTRDLEELKSMSFSQSADQRTLELLEINDLNADTAYSWLRDRVSVVIEDTDVTKLKIKAQNFSGYPSNQPAIIEKAMPRPATGGGSKGVTVMSNIGTGLYYAGKTASQLFTLKVKTGFLSSKSFQIVSPRTGVIQIGEGLFMKKYLINSKNELSKANGLGRMSTFFHEARHSDGSGAGIGFFHAVCPSDHDFAGVHACDRNLNGPYTVGAQIIKEFIKNCDDCSVSEKEKLRLRYLDSLNRVLTNTPKVLDSDDMDLESLKIQLSTQKTLYEIERMTGRASLATYNKMVDLEQRVLAAAKAADALELIPSQNWNPAPEAVRL
mgnify:CR=1 FL=1|tara:strand:+ start:155 stop:1240 length:1086 start_codon:yes stop_codon:yes gene_type:complete